MEKINFEQALDQYYNIVTVKGVEETLSSVSISFYEDWTGEENCYILDTMTDDIKPRLFSLDTAHMIKQFSLPKKRATVKLDALTEKVAKEFKEASEAIKTQELVELEQDALERKVKDLNPAELQGVIDRLKASMEPDEEETENDA